MNCTYATPVTYDGTVPDDAADFWQYSEIECDVSEFTATSPAEISTISGTVAISDSQFNSISDFVHLNFFFMVIVLVYIGFQLASFMFRRSA